MTKRISLATLVLFLLVASLCLAGGNLVQNSSFEDETAGKPTAWDTWAWQSSPDVTAYTIGTGKAKSGRKYITIVNRTENDARYRQAIAVKANTYYRLSGWIKTEDVGTQKTGACLSVDGYVYTSPDLRGTNSVWQYVEMNLQTGSDIKTITITAGLGAYGNTTTGKASFDDVRLEELNQAPAGNIAPIGQAGPAGNPVAKPPSRFPSLLILAAVAVAAVIYGAWRYFGPKAPRADGEPPDASELVGK